MNITIAQFTPLLGNKKKNLEKIEQIIKESKEDSTDLIIFPELCLTGYAIHRLSEDISEKLQGESVQTMQNLCLENKVNVVFSFPQRNDKGLYNTAVYINDGGEIQSIYQKTHLFDKEANIFERGEHFPIVQTSFGNIGLMICYDLEFPEVARILKMKGADLIVSPTANMVPYAEYQEIYTKSRAMENEVPLAVCNRTGKEEEMTFFGQSMIVDAFGNSLLKLGSKEEIKTIHVPLNLPKDPKLDYLHNRQADLYSDLIY